SPAAPHQARSVSGSAPAAVRRNFRSPHSAQTPNPAAPSLFLESCARYPLPLACAHTPPAILFRGIPLLALLFRSLLPRKTSSRKLSRTHLVRNALRESSPKYYAISTSTIAGFFLAHRREAPAPASIPPAQETRMNDDYEVMKTAKPSRFSTCKSPSLRDDQYSTPPMDACTALPCALS